MSRRAIGILIIIFGIIIILASIYFLFFGNYVNNSAPSNPEPVVNNAVVQPDNNLSIEEEKQIIKKITKKPKPQNPTSDDLKRLAASFAERFGSYSNHSNYSNIVDLKIFMTPKMQAWADRFVQEAETKAANSINEIYYGVTTKAISQNVDKFDEDMGEAEILVKTQRRESSGTMNNTTTFYQNVLIKLVKEKGAWKVSSAYWQDK